MAPSMSSSKDAPEKEF